MEQVLNREAIEVKVPSTKISDYYGVDLSTVQWAAH